MTTEDDIVSQIARYCLEQRMFNGDSVLAALSGGGDSVALLVLLLELQKTFGITVSAAHLNHALRGDESDRDESFCRDLCVHLNVPFISKKLEPGAITRLEGSVETAARNVRMAFLDETATAIGADKIATGHTADDQVETVLQRLFRGTGPTGLTGILPVRDGRWVRPMLCVGKNMLRDFLLMRGIPYREDASNSDTTYQRNKIRHRILPMLREEFGDTIDQAIIRLANISREQESWINEEVEQSFESCCVYSDGFKILLEKTMFISYHILIQQRIVRRCLKHLEGAGRDEDSEEVFSILNMLMRKRGIVKVTAAVTAESNERFFAFSRSLNRYNPICLACPGETVLPFECGSITASNTEMQIPAANTVRSVVLPLSIIERMGMLSAGTVRAGELIYAVNSKRSVRIRDLFSNACIPTSFRETIPVIHAGAVPLWIPGLTRAADTTVVSGENPVVRCVQLNFEGGIQWR